MARVAVRMRTAMSRKMERRNGEEEEDDNAAASIGSQTEAVDV